MSIQIHTLFNNTAHVKIHTYKYILYTIIYKWYRTAQILTTDNEIQMAIGCIQFFPKELSMQNHSLFVWLFTSTCIDQFLHWRAWICNKFASYYSKLDAHMQTKHQGGNSISGNCAKKMLAHCFYHRGTRPFHGFWYITLTS